MILIFSSLTSVYALSSLSVFFPFEAFFYFFSFSLCPRNNGHTSDTADRRMEVGAGEAAAELVAALVGRGFGLEKVSVDC